MKAPAFQWYAAEYLADERVMLMSLEAEGAYVRLLSLCWREGSIPANPLLLAAMCKHADQKIIKEVVPCFTKTGAPSGRLIHKRLEQEREKQEAYRAKQSAKGLMGGRPRKADDKPEQSHGKATALPQLNHGLTTVKPVKSSSVSSSTSPANTADAVAAAGQALKAKPVPAPRWPPLDEDEPTSRFADSGFNTSAWAVWVLEMRKVPGYAGVDYEHYRQQIRLADLGVNEQLPNRSWKKKLLNWLKNDLTATGGPRLVLALAGVDLSQPTPREMLPPVGTDCTGRHIVLPNTGDANMNRMRASNYTRDYPNAIIHHAR